MCRYDKRPEVVEDECGLGVVDPELVRRGDKVRILHHQPKDFTTEARFSEKDFEVRLGNSALFHLFTVILCFSLTSRRTSCLWWTTSEAGTGSVAALRLARSFGPRELGASAGRSGRSDVSQKSCRIWGLEVGPPI